MKNKLLILLFAIITLGYQASAQKKKDDQLSIPNNEEQSAKSANPFESAKEAYNNYNKLKSLGGDLSTKNLKNAQTAIDKAVAGSDSENAEAWAYKALIYSSLALVNSESANLNASVTQTNISINKAKELDKKGKNKSKIEEAQKNLQLANKSLEDNSFNDAGNAFNNKDYVKAYESFSRMLASNPTDTALMMNSALSAYNAKNYKAAVKHYTDLLTTNVTGMPNVYASLADAYIADKDTVSALKTLADGTAKFPKSSQLVSREITLSLNAGRSKEVISKIEAQMQAEPTNKFYPYYAGVAYEAMKESSKSQDAYKKAIAIDPAFTEAYINLGSVIINHGIDMYNINNKKFSAYKTLTQAQSAEYNNGKKKAMAEMDKALPYLTKATELDPKSIVALDGLRVYYKVKSDSAKVAELDAKIKSLQ